MVDSDEYPIFPTHRFEQGIIGCACELLVMNSVTVMSTFEEKLLDA